MANMRTISGENVASNTTAHIYKKPTNRIFFFFISFKMLMFSRMLLCPTNIIKHIHKYQATAATFLRKMLKKVTNPSLTDKEIENHTISFKAGN